MKTKNCNKERAKFNAWLDSQKKIDDVKFFMGNISTLTDEKIYKGINDLIDSDGVEVKNMDEGLVFKSISQHIDSFTV